MISKINSIAINGLNSSIIEVETDINLGLPSFTIVGLADTSVQESKERLRSSLKSSGFGLPTSRITINLAPASIKKSGPHFDLPIALGILHHMGMISSDDYMRDSIFLGELSLDGSLRAIDSILPSVIGASELGYKNIFIPYDNYLEASVVEDINIYPIQNLKQLINFLNQNTTINIPSKLEVDKLPETMYSSLDFEYIVGQSQAKRALEIRARGMHNILLSGPPGSGKTMLSKTFMTILPDMSYDEMIESSKIYSISGLLSSDTPLITHRPFREVHHTASPVSIIGGGTKAKPGEISLAHNGVLFFDEVLEFPRATLEVLRQPLEDGEINVSRIHGSYNYPAKFIFLGSMNPCPCGYLTDPDRECECSFDQIKRYKSRLSGPMVDRIDISIEVPKVRVEDFTKRDKSTGESSATIKLRVQKARDIQSHRFKNSRIYSNSEMSSKDVEIYCPLDETSKNMLLGAMKSLNLTTRGYYKILKLSRTIRDLEGVVDISSNHIAEAISYRKID